MKKLRSLVKALCVIGCVVGLSSCGVPHTREYSRCMVENKDRTSMSNGSSDMRVYTTCGVFSVDDDIIKWRFNSADVYANIKVGHTYDFEAGWWRIDWLSRFPNIFTVKELQE